MPRPSTITGIAFSAAPGGDPERLGDLVDRGQAGRRHLARRVERRRQLDRLRLGAEATSTLAA